MASFSKVRTGSVIKLRQAIHSAILGDRADRPEAEVLDVEPRSFRIRVFGEDQCRVLPKQGADFTLVRR